MSAAEELEVTVPEWLLKLNTEQRAAVEHDGSPLLILAGAGTGKTRTLVARLARLLHDGAPADRILLVTFSRRASEEMKRRVSTMVDPALARQVQAGTFHATANRLLRVYGSALGLSDSFSVLDKSDVTDLMGLVRTDLGFGSRKRFPKKETLANIYSRLINAQIPLDDVLSTWFPWCMQDDDGIRQIFSGYTDRKRAQSLLDYDDLLLFWRAAVKHPVTGPVMAKLFDHILVDEYQDTNVLQSDILRGLASEGAQVTVVGDDAQSIYSFRSATVRNILDFGQHFDNATQVTLEQNYRSTQPVLALANAVIADATAGYRKNLWSTQTVGAKPRLFTCPDERSQVEAVCDSILEHFEQGIQLRDQAVLFRASHHSDVLEVELRHRNIPFVKYGGLKFLEAAHVRDLVGLLRILENPYDELAWSRVLSLMEGVGPATAARITAELNIRPITAYGVQPLEAFRSVTVPKTAVEDRDRLAEAFALCKEDGLSTGAQIDALRAAVDPMVRRRYDNAEVRLRDLDQLAHLAADSTSRSRLLSDLTLDPPASTGDLAGAPLLDDDYLILSTVHSAKGGEWRSVHVLHASDGMFPSDMATGSTDEIDEERRLFYVALTRAQEHLHLYAPLRYHHGGAVGMTDAHSFAQRTRFLPPSVDHLLDFRAVRSSVEDLVIDLTGEQAQITAAVDEELRNLW